MRCLKLSEKVKRRFILFLVYWLITNASDKVQSEFKWRILRLFIQSILIKKHKYNIRLRDLYWKKIWISFLNIFKKKLYEYIFKCILKNNNISRIFQHVLNPCKELTGNIQKFQANWKMLRQGIWWSLFIQYTYQTHSIDMRKYRIYTSQ